jgi:Tfp pilus assembly protein PilO
MKLDISLGYLSLHESEKASNIFALIDTTGMIGQSLRYLSVKPDIFEANKKYSDAFQALKRYQITSEIENSRIYSQKTTVAEELHELMIEHLYSIQRKDRQLWFGVCILLVLIIVVGVVYYQLRLSKKNRIISEQKQSRLQLENENLQKQNFVLGLEKHNAELECERQHLAAENMKLRISQLESEGEHLKELLTEAKLSKPILASIQERIGILNGLLAAKISDNDVYSKPYDKWINQITEDRKSFMDSTRLAFRASHPAFMKYLDDHGLTESELNYVCLYAIGLRGKEIGEYIQLKRHYHMSTDIRKKLGLSEDDTNLGLHIRNLMKNL